MPVSVACWLTLSQDVGRPSRSNVNSSILDHSNSHDMMQCHARTDSVFYFWALPKQVYSSRVTRL